MDGFVSNWIPLLLLSDTCYVLSFAIIMLNTSLHNPNVRDKPPVERFISMNRGINEGGDLPEELLRVRIGPYTVYAWWLMCVIAVSHTYEWGISSTVWIIVSLPLSAEPLRQHQKWALQNPRGRRERSDTHILQPRQRGLALKARYVQSDLQK